MGNNKYNLYKEKKMTKLQHKLHDFLNSAKSVLTSNTYHKDNLCLVESKNKINKKLFILIELFYKFIEKKHPSHTSEVLCEKFMESFDDIHDLVNKDLQSAYDRDPSAYSKLEIILCFPGVEAIILHRISHELHNLGIVILPRLIAKEVHMNTSIDIHPGAQIGSNFFIDHGIGVVIGETCIVGNNVTLYHGVTLGAKNFPRNEDNTLIRNIKRHPNIANNVTIYSNSTILGDITIGSGSIIGANVSITKDIQPNSRVYQQKYQQVTFENGMGI